MLRTAIGESTLNFSYSASGADANPTAATPVGTTSAHQRGHWRDATAAASPTSTTGTT